jgi:hypothetical protein
MSEVLELTPSHASWDEKCQIGAGNADAPASRLRECQCPPMCRGACRAYIHMYSVPAECVWSGGVKTRCRFDFMRSNYSVRFLAIALRLLDCRSSSHRFIITL